MLPETVWVGAFWWMPAMIPGGSGCSTVLMTPPERGSASAAVEARVAAAMAMVKGFFMVFPVELWLVGGSGRLLRAWMKTSDQRRLIAGSPPAALHRTIPGWRWRSVRVLHTPARCG